MADHDQKVDKKMGQNDKNLIQDVAMEVKDKDKSKTQSQEDIEAKIEEGYIKLKGDINSRLTPLLQALTEAGVDGGLIASVEKEIHTNSRMLFFNRVMNSDINDMEEIRKLVQKESLQYLKPLFEDGEIDHDDIKISSNLSKNDFEQYLLDNVLEKQNVIEEYKEIETSKVYDFENKEFEKVFGKENGSTDYDKLKDVEKKYVQLIDKNMKNIDSLIKQADSDDPEIAKRAQMILSITGSTIQNGTIDKAFEDVDYTKKIDMLHSIYLLGRLYTETGDPFVNNLLVTCSDIIGIEGLVTEDENGKTIFNFDKIEKVAAENSIELIKSSEKVMDETFWIQGFENYGDSLDFMVDTVIGTRRSEMKDVIGSVYNELGDGSISLEDAQKKCEELFSSNIDAANVALEQLIVYMPKEPSKSQLDLYNFATQKILSQYVNAPKGYKIDSFAMSAITNSMKYVLKEGIDKLNPETLELFNQVIEKNKGIILDPTKGINPSFIEKYEELEKIIRGDEELQFIVSPEYLEELDRQDAEREAQEREAQERDVTQITLEQKKNNMLKAMTGMTKSKGLVKSQEWMDNLITNYPDKELIAEAVVEFLEKQKETDEHFMDEDSKEARESVFESIVLSGIDNPEIFGRMQKIDRETSKVVVKNVIEQVNSSRSVLNNVVSAIQALGKNLNEPEQEVEQDKIVEDTPLGFLNPEETELPKVDMFDNKRGNRGNEEPEDDWIR